MSSEDHPVAVDGDKQPVAEDVTEQQDAPRSETSINDVESDEQNVANIERIYRQANPTIRRSNLTFEPQNLGPSHHLCILGPLFPMFCHPFKCRPSPNNERRLRPRPRRRPPSNPPPNLNRSSPILRLLCNLRPPLESNYDPPKSARMDESHRHKRRFDRKLSRRNESSLELLVRSPQHVAKSN